MVFKATAKVAFSIENISLLSYLIFWFCLTIRIFHETVAMLQLVYPHIFRLIKKAALLGVSTDHINYFL